ncbi:hypothetical protein [Caloramator sp. mosi_1]|uniref:hypothetical protein n=1 Tax=Caloramator sp. mosi_1 TaxID=3023090 RepID=UPI00308192F6
MLEKNEKLNIEEILQNLENYRPKRKGWHWREEQGNQVYGEFEYHQASKPLKNSCPLPAAKVLDILTHNQTV